MNASNALKAFMPDPNASKDRVFHLLPVKSAAELCGISTKLLLNAAHAGQMGNVEILRLGEQDFVRACSLIDFIDGKPRTSAPDTARRDPSDLFA